MPARHCVARWLRWAGLAAGLAAAGLGQAQNLKPGDLMFTAYNTQQDGWALVALVDLAPGTTVYFSDNAWVGGSFAPGGGYERWNSGTAPIAAGTVVRFSDIDDALALTASLGSISRAIVPGSTYLNLSQTAGTLYAYQGTAPAEPSVFLTAVSNGGFAPTTGALVGTGLAAGSSALLLPASSQYAEYTATRSAPLAADTYRGLLANAGNWGVLNGGSYAAQVASVAPLAVIPVPEPGGTWLLLAGACTLGMAGLRRRHAPTLISCDRTSPLHGLTSDVSGCCHRGLEGSRSASQPPRTWG